MREITGVELKLAAPAGKLWSVIASVGGVDKWSPLITSCTVEGAGKGAKRFCTMANGAKLKEVIDEVDNNALRFRYRITEGLPVEGLEGTIHVQEIDGANALVTWQSSYSVQPENAAGFRQMIIDAYSASLKGLEQHCRN